MIAKAIAARGNSAKANSRKGFLGESDRRERAAERIRLKEEHLAAREAGKIAAAALVEEALATETFCDDANATASDRLLALLREYHKAGDTHAH